MSSRAPTGRIVVAGVLALAVLFVFGPTAFRVLQALRHHGVERAMAAAKRFEPPWRGPLVVYESAAPEEVGLDAPARREYPVYAEVYPLSAQSHSGRWRALFDGDYKFLWNSLGAHRLHEVVADPGEITNLVALEPERAAAMQQSLESFHASLAPPPKADAGSVDPETRHALETLGYLD